MGIVVANFASTMIDFAIREKGDLRMSKDPYGPLLPIMQRFGATGSTKEFYWAVNDAFHRFEAPHYDQFHVDMYAEEESVWRRLLTHLPPNPTKLRFLDIGCGTGLVEHFLAKLTPDRVIEASLLDPSQSMIDRIREKSSDWPFLCRFILGDVTSISADGSFDVVTINSVLHHIVELETFCQHVQGILRPGGILLTAQDPRAGATADPEFRRRYAAAVARHHNPARFVNAALRRFRRLFSRRVLSPMELETSKPLLEKRLITRPMDSRSIYAVTDFHVPGQPGNLGGGIDADRLQAWMPDMRPVGYFTYSFHGIPWTQLKEGQRAQEQIWFQERDVHGVELATAWKRT